MTVRTPPRAMIGRVFAQAGPAPDIRAAIDSVTQSIEDFKVKNSGRLSALETGVQAAIDEMNGKLASIGLSAAGGTLAPPPIDPEYNRAFASWSRKGDQERELRELNAVGRRSNIQASMNSGSDSAGGFLAPVEWDRTISSVLRNVSPMRRLATVQTTSVRAFTRVWDNRSWGLGWVGETAARPETSTPTLAGVPFGHGEIYANPAITQQLLDDADFPIEEWLADSVGAEFTQQEGPTFVAGNGTNKPYGFLTYVTGGANAALHPGGAIQLNTVAGTTAITADELIDVVYALSAIYRQNATWLMNSLTASKIAKLKDGQGNYLWSQNVAIGTPSTLLGYRVEIDENMPNMATGALPIAFGDFQRGYLINDRMGVRVLRDPYSNKPYVMFYVTKRVGGGVQDPNAIRVVKMA